MKARSHHPVWRMTVTASDELLRDAGIDVFKHMERELRAKLADAEATLPEDRFVLWDLSCFVEDEIEVDDFMDDE